MPAGCLVPQPHHTALVMHFHACECMCGHVCMSVCVCMYIVCINVYVYSVCMYV